MKGAIAAFVAAVAGHLASGAPRGSISLLITGDEEGPAVDGTVRVLEWMAANGQIPDFCLVGEPTCAARLGDTIKIGRRGSMNAVITVHGTQGPRRLSAARRQSGAPADPRARRADRRPAGRRQRMVRAIDSLQLTSVDVGNPAANVIPAAARAALNIRFNDRHSGASLTAWLRATLAQHAERFDLDVAISGESFLTPPGPLVDTLRRRDRARRPAWSRGSTPAAARPTPASSRAGARWPSSVWSAPRCTRPTNACRSPNCAISPRSIARCASRRSCGMSGPRAAAPGGRCLRSAFSSSRAGRPTGFGCSARPRSVSRQPRAAARLSARRRVLRCCRWRRAGARCGAARRRSARCWRRR